jgi:siroheme synthase-like protein
MPNGLPVVLQLERQPCLVIGETAEAGAKAEMLARAGAVVTRLTGYQPGCLAGFTLAIAALEDRSLNAEIFAEAEGSGVLVNCVDDPPHCRFILASVFEQGALQIAVSTGGACPALAVRIRERLQSLFGAEFAAFLAIASELRPEISARVPDFQRRRALWYELVDSPVLDLLASGKEREARGEIARLIERAAKEAPHASGH